MKTKTPSNQLRLVQEIESMQKQDQYVPMSDNWREVMRALRAWEMGYRGDSMIWSLASLNLIGWN